MEPTKEVEIILLDNNIFWPFYNKKKAFSANSLTKFIKEIEYKDIPDYIMQLAIKKGKLFHETVQEYFHTGKYPSFIDLAKNPLSLRKNEKRIYETIVFLKEHNLLKNSIFIGSEELHYTFFEGELIASLVDVHLDDCIIELKTNNLSYYQKNPLSLMTIEIQLLIQNLCTKKNVYLLWSTGEGVVFSKFEINKQLLSILSLLIDTAKKIEPLTAEEKEIVIKKILSIYTPIKLNIINVFPMLR